MRDILAIDVGTSSLEVAVFDSKLQVKKIAHRIFNVNFYEGVKADIEPEQWWAMISECWIELKDYLHSVGVISLSVTTPGLVAMSEDGNALSRAILFCDGRSNKQAKEIRKLVGEEYFLRETCNLPISGGSSLCSILWIRDNFPELWSTATKFGHCNTYLVKRLTGNWVIDPTTVSITGMYNTKKDDLTWNEKVLSIAGIPISKLPPLLRTNQCAGSILPEIAHNFGIPKDTDVLVGGNDAVLATLSGGTINNGEMNHIHGTCDIISVCTEKPIYSPKFNVRCHVIPNRWLTFFVLNTGGKALEWFYHMFCQDMSIDYFYGEYVPSVLNDFLHNPSINQMENYLPVYVPFLQGSRYSLKKLTAGFSNLTVQTTRETMLIALIKGNLTYEANHIKEISKLVQINPKVRISGGAAQIEGFIEAKRRWVGDYQYEYKDQSSLYGAAIIGQKYLFDHAQ
jgi:sugar (pentulose or hexulose) kinase